MLYCSDYLSVNAHIDNGMKLYHCLDANGVCYIASHDLPTIDNTFVLCEIPTKYARNPKIYDSSLWRNGCFWYVNKK